MNEQTITFECYLSSSGMSKGSIQTYLYQIRNFVTAYPEAPKFKYKDILNVLEEMAAHKPNATYRQGILAAIKKYYDYLIQTGQREDHPCRRLNIQRNKSKKPIHQDFFTTEELELLMNREERFPELKWKNQVVLSLLIYQGLTSGEIANMKVRHINLEEGKIFVKESAKNSRRHLDMHPKQYQIFDRYINQSRNQLLQVDSDLLIIGMRGVPTSTGEICYLVEQFKPLFPDRNLNPSTIRQSVISNWINERKHPIELVQLMAGHKTMSTTLLYRVTATDEKRILINRFHPLG
jgi:integrase/recombinase XerD